MGKDFNKKSLKRACTRARARVRFWSENPCAESYGVQIYHVLDLRLFRSQPTGSKFKKKIKKNREDRIESKFRTLNSIMSNVAMMVDRSIGVTV